MKEPNYSWSLDLARVIALGAVLFHHSTQTVNNWLQWGFGRKLSMVFGHGFIGVDLFFVLSGYLLSTQLIRIANTPLSSQPAIVRNFYFRRLLRTWPGYFLVLLIIYFLLPHVSFAARGASNYLSEFSWHNLVFLSNYDLNHSALDVTWSLCLEEQFYLLIPVLYLISSQRLRIGLLTGICVLATIARAWIYFTKPGLVAGDYPGFWYFQANLLFHPEGFVAGLLLGEITLKNFWPIASRKLAVTFLVLGALVIYFYGWNAVGAFSVIALFPFLAVYFQIFIWDIRFWKLQRLAPILHFVSLRTYSIYLIHTISNELLKPYLLEWPAVWAWVVGLTAAFISGCLFYCIAEMPFEGLRARLRTGCHS